MPSLPYAAEGPYAGLKRAVWVLAMVHGLEASIIHGLDLLAMIHGLEASRSCVGSGCSASDKAPGDMSSRSRRSPSLAAQLGNMKNLSIYSPATHLA